MPKTVIIDEIHLTIRVPTGLPDARAETVRLILLGTAFMTRLRRAVREVVRAFPNLTKARASLTR